MKPNIQPPPIRLNHEPKDRAAISAALAQLDSNSTSQARQLAIIGPECDGIRRDSSSFYGSVDAVIVDFLNNTANRKSQFALALRSLIELQRQTLSLVPVIAADAEGMEIEIRATVAELVTQVRAKLEMHLQPWFSEAQLPVIMNRASLMLRANGLAQQHSTTCWGFSLLNTAQETSLSSGKNSAGEILRAYRAQLAAFEKARADINALAEEVEKI